MGEACLQDSFRQLREEKGQSLAEPDVLISAVGTVVYQRCALYAWNLERAESPVVSKAVLWCCCKDKLLHRAQSLLLAG